MAPPEQPQRTRRGGDRRRRIRAKVAPPPGCAPDAIVLTFPVPRELSGWRLDRFIQRRIPRLSRTRAQQIVRACAFRQDGTKRRPGELVRAGEVVLLVRERFVEPDVPLDFRVLHDDGEVLALDKPAGLPMHPTATYHKHTLSYLLRQRYGDEAPRIAHRLDRETSGIVLCGYPRRTERALKLSFEHQRVDKSYLAIVRGELASDEGRIDLPLAPVEEGLHVLMEVRETGEGSPAETLYRVVQRRHGMTLLELSPKTGRQHQLRVHLSAIGHPIVGDKLYGPEREAPFLEHIETGMTEALRQRLGHHRQALHAHRITFPHPGSRQPVTLCAPLASDLAELWAGPDSAARFLASPGHSGYG